MNVLIKWISGYALCRLAFHLWRSRKHIHNVDVVSVLCDITDEFRYYDISLYKDVDRGCTSTTDMIQVSCEVCVSKRVDCFHTRWYIPAWRSTSGRREIYDIRPTYTIGEAWRPLKWKHQKTERQKKIDEIMASLPEIR